MAENQPTTKTEEYKESFAQVTRWTYAGIVAALINQILQVPANIAGVLAATPILLLILLAMALLFWIQRNSEPTLSRQCPSCEAEFRIYNSADLEKYETHVWNCYEFPDLK